MWPIRRPCRRRTAAKGSASRSRSHWKWGQSFRSWMYILRIFCVDYSADSPRGAIVFTAHYAVNMVHNLRMPLLALVFLVTYAGAVPQIWCRIQKTAMIGFVLVEARQPSVTRGAVPEVRSPGERGWQRSPPKSAVAAFAQHGWGARLTPAHCHPDL